MKYELLRLGRDGSVTDAVIIDAADDQAACARGYALSDGRMVEVWRGSQHVATLRPKTGYSIPPDQ